MLNNISWQGYWISLALIVAGYYLAIYLLYFRNDFSISLLRRTNKKSDGGLDTVAPLPFTAIGPVQENRQPSLFDEAEEFLAPPLENNEHSFDACMDELKAFFGQARRSKCIKEELIFSLQRIVGKYPTLTTSGYKETLTGVIKADCQEMCSIHLSAEDLARVWTG